MSDAPVIRYAKHGDVHVAYHVPGAAGPDLLALLQPSGEHVDRAVQPE